MMSLAILKSRFTQLLLLELFLGILFSVLQQYNLSAEIAALLLDHQPACLIIAAFYLPFFLLTYLLFLVTSAFIEPASEVFEDIDEVPVIVATAHQQDHDHGLIAILQRQIAASASSYQNLLSKHSKLEDDYQSQYDELNMQKKRCTIYQDQLMDSATIFKKAEASAAKKLSGEHAAEMQLVRMSVYREKKNIKEQQALLFDSKVQSAAENITQYLKNDFDGAIQVIGRLKTDVKHHEEAGERFWARVCRLEQEKKESEAQCQKEIARLTAQKDTALYQVTEHCATIKSMVEQVHKLEKDLSGAEKEITIQKDAVETWELHVEGLEEDISASATELSDAQDQIDILEKDLSASSTELSNAQEQIDTLHKKNLEMEKDLAFAGEELASHKDTIKALETKIVNLDGMMAAQSQASDSDGCTIVKKVKTIKAMKKKIIRNDRTIKNSTRENEVLQTALDRQNMELVKKTTSLSIVGQEIESLHMLLQAINTPLPEVEEIEAVELDTGVCMITQPDTCSNGVHSFPSSIAVPIQQAYNLDVCFALFDLSSSRLAQGLYSELFSSQRCDSVVLYKPVYDTRAVVFGQSIQVFVAVLKKSLEVQPFGPRLDLWSGSWKSSVKSHRRGQGVGGSTAMVKGTPSSSSAGSPSRKRSFDAINNDASDLKDVELRSPKRWATDESKTEISTKMKQAGDAVETRIRIRTALGPNNAYMTNADSVQGIPPAHLPAKEELQFSTLLNSMDIGKPFGNEMDTRGEWRDSMTLSIPGLGPLPAIHHSDPMDVVDAEDPDAMEVSDDEDSSGSDSMDMSP